MFCFQCQEALNNSGCTVRGVCGKKEETADLQDVLVYVCKGMSLLSRQLQKSAGRRGDEEGRFVVRALFATITNANFDSDRFAELIREALAHNRRLRAELGAEAEDLPAPATWDADSVAEFYARVPEASVLTEEDADA